MNKKLIGIVVAVVLVVGGGITTFFLTRGGSEDAKSEQGSNQSDGQSNSQGDASGSLPSDMPGVLAALEAKRALYCSYRLEEDGLMTQMTQQVAAGGAKQKVRITGEMLVEGEAMPVDLTSLILDNEAIYVWGDEGATTDLAMKIDWSTWQTLDPEAQKGYNPAGELADQQDTIKQVNCRAPEDMDFNVPDKNWLDLGNFL